MKEAMPMYYDPKIWYKHDLSFNFMNLNELFINRNKKVEQING